MTLSAASTFLFADVALLPIFPASDIAPVTASSATLFVTVTDDGDNDDLNRDKLNDDDCDDDDDSNDNFLKVFGAALEGVEFCCCSCCDDKGLDVVIVDIIGKEIILSEDVNKFKSESQYSFPVSSLINYYISSNL